MLRLSWVETSKVSSQSWKRVEEDEEWCVELILCCVSVWGASLQPLRALEVGNFTFCRKMKNVRKRV